MTLRSILFPLILLLWSTMAISQIQIVPGGSATIMSEALIGNGITVVGNPVMNCDGNAFGQYSNASGLGLSNGIIMTTGSAVGAAGPNTTSGFGQSNFISYNDPDLTGVVASATNDVCLLELDIVPQCDSLTIRFMFGSEEYEEYINGSYNDAFGFFITGQNPAGGNYNAYNLARLPNNTAVSINSVNPTINSNYYNNNDGGNLLQYDGYTTLLSPTIAVVPCQTYHFKIIIADAGDFGYDSGVLIDFLTCSSAMEATVTTQAANCGNPDGSASLDITGGSGSYSIDWSMQPANSTTTASGLAAGSYQVTLTDNLSACSTPLVLPVVILAEGPLPTINATTPMLDVCLNDMVGIDYGADAPITWLGPQPLVDNGTTAYFEITEVTEVILEATNGCGSSTVSFLFTLPPLVDVVINTPPSICTGSDLVLTAAAAGITNFTWTLPSFGNINGNNLNLGMSTVAMSGNYTVEAVQGNCVVGDTSVFIVVGDAPTVVVDYPTLCAGQSAHLEVTPVDNYTWDNMNTLILSNQGSSATATPGITTTYHLSSATGCSTSVTIEVLNSPSADIALNTLEGCGPLQVIFTDNTPDPLNFLWNFGDGTTSVLESPSHTFPAAATGDTTYTVMLTITNGATCSESQSYYIHVLEGVTSLFDATPIVQNWPGNTVVFTNNSTGSGNLTAQWNFGNNLQSGVYNNVSSQYATWGEYTVTLTVTNGFCSDQSSQVIQILPPPPVADFTAFVNVCPFESFTVYSTSQFADSTFWHWGDGSITLGTEASHSYASSGNYSLTLVVKGFNGTYDTLTHVNAVTVHPAPVADFDFFSSTIAAVVDSALIDNTCLGATAYTWILGNGDTSHVAEPTPFYSLVGSYPVVLIAENQFGCHDTTSKILEVVSDGFLDFPNAFTPDGFAHPGSYDATALDNNIFHPHHRSVKEYQLAVFNKWGEMIFQTSDVHKGWDGFYNNDICPQDVYVYRAWGKFYGDVSFDKAGEIHLLFGK